MWEAASFQGGQLPCNHQADVVSGKGLVGPVTQGSNPDSAVKGLPTLGKVPVLPTNPGAGLQVSKAPAGCLESTRVRSTEEGGKPQMSVLCPKSAAR